MLMLPGWLHGAGFWRTVTKEMPAGSCGLALDWSDGLKEERLIERIDGMSSPVILAGWSLGAMAAMRIAIACPGRVTALVLAGATARLPEDRGYPGVSLRRLRGMRISLRRDAGSCYRAFLGLCGVGDSACEDLVTELSDTPVSLSDSGLDALIRWDLREQVKDVAVPVYMTHGRNDRVIPLSQAEWLRAHLPGGGGLRIIDGEDHIPGKAAWRGIIGDIKMLLEDDR